MLPHISHTILLVVITLCRVCFVSAIGGADSEGYPYVFLDASGAGFNILGSDQAKDIQPELYANASILQQSVMLFAGAALSLSDLNTTTPSFSFPINENHTSQKEDVFGFSFDMSHVEVEAGAIMTPTETGTYTFQFDYTGLSAAIVILKEAYYCGGVDNSMALDIIEKSMAADVSSGPDYTSQVTKTLLMEAGQTYLVGFVYFSVFNETYHNTQQYASMDFSMILPSGETVTDFSDYVKNQQDKSASATCLYYDTTSITATGTDTYIVTGIETVTLTPTGTALGTAAVPIVEELHYVILPSGYTMTDSPSSSSYESSSTQVSSSVESSSIPPSSSSIESSSAKISSSGLPSSTAKLSSSYSSSADLVLSSSLSSHTPSLSEYTSSSIVSSVASSSETSATGQPSAAYSVDLSSVSSFLPTVVSSLSKYSSSSGDTVYENNSDLKSSEQESVTSLKSSFTSSKSQSSAVYTSLSGSFSSVPNRNVVSSNVSESSRVQSSSFTITGSAQSSEILSRSNGIISSSIGEVSASLSKSSTGPYESSPVSSATARYSNPSGVDDQSRSVTSSLSIQSIVQPFGNTTSPSNQVASQSLTTKTITNPQGVVMTTVVSCESSSNANSVETTEVIESRKAAPSTFSTSEEYSSKVVTRQVFNGASNNGAGNVPSQVVQSKAVSRGTSTVVGQHSAISTNVAHSKEGSGVAQFGAATTVLSVAGKASPTAILYSPESGNAAQHNSVGFVITLLSLLSFSAWF
ncbi:hypothetical protein DAKH74_039950 [Maudiozyma humilis]|uniref:Uncharacterized protein n=1 Tax=Maudiozyma humilis TaxID=51915 RepID=A0AAV5S3V9_MAUHU|nr:hypothetical protein DAKH74_039950 [Kazachstania humilis]